jgi:hypothetical protein
MKTVEETERVTRVGEAKTQARQMSSDLTFLTNEQGNTLRDRFQVLLGDNTRFF